MAGDCVLRISILLCVLHEYACGYDDRIPVRKCNNGGCPYAASWLAPIDLMMKIQWPLNSTKMEEASFRLLQSGLCTTYQLSSPYQFYVNHLSEFEHNVRRKTHNVSLAVEKSSIVSAGAMNTECSRENRRVQQSHTFYTALIPFFGGLPVNTTRDLKVRSVGEGNSVVSRAVKAWQAMATVCSLMRYFGRVVVGVASAADEAIMKEHLSELSLTDPLYGSNVHIVRFNLSRGSNLPFYLLAWTQLTLKEGDCLSRCTRFVQDQRNLKQYLPPVSCDYCDLTEDNALYYQHVGEIVSKSVLSAPPSSVVLNYPVSNIRYIYYTECDQILYFNGTATLDAVTAASSSRTVVLGRRRYKQGKKFPAEYDKVLAKGPGCGKEGYYISRQSGVQRNPLESGQA